MDQENTLEELSFLQAVPVFKCDPTVKAQPLHERHHVHVQRALTHFLRQVEEKTIIARQKQSLTTQHRRAIHYIKALQNWEHIGEKEKQDLAGAIDTIKMGRFQGLPRDINKLHTGAKKGRLNPAVQLQSLLEILHKHIPNADGADARDTQHTGNGAPTEAADDRPRVIISQSYI